MVMAAAAESVRLSMLRERIAALADPPAARWELTGPAPRQRDVGRDLA
jgi:hypothetical protein